MDEELKFSKKAFITKQEDINEFYVIEPGELGKGSIGIVKKATHKMTKQECAIKVIPKFKIKDVERFKTEVNILRKVDHPNIIKLFEWFEDKSNMYLVMELCSGGELFSKIETEEEMTEKDVAHMIKQVLLAISYCHKNKIVHRDIKPENFLFETKEKGSVIKLVDFGLSRLFDDPKIGFVKMKTKVGTPYYVAPEVLAGDYNYKCDIWSAGVILYMLICGYPPFNGENINEILDAIKNGIFDFEGEEWLNVSIECKELICRLICKDISSRYTADQALKHTWIRTTALTSKGKLNSSIYNFRTMQKFKKAVLMYIATKTADKELGKLRETFISMDTDHDGKISLEELREAMLNQKIEGNFTELFKIIDADKSGFVDYTEFLAATMEKSLYLSEDKISFAFAAFDTDKSGKISAKELKLMLGEDLSTSDEHIWTEMIKEVDLDNDGEINFTEFQKMMGNVKGSSKIMSQPKGDIQM